jgi:tetratricopeptide (TPR) repeat protein
MPILHSADRITWLHFQPQGGGKIPSAEVNALAGELGSRMQIVQHGDPVQWLVQRLNAGRRRRVISMGTTMHSTTPQSAVPRLPSAIEEDFRKLPLVERRLAVGRVLIHVDQSQAAYLGLRRAAHSHPRDPRIPLEIADTLTILQRRKQALRSYSRSLDLSTSPENRASALLGTAGLLANGGRYTEAFARINDVETEARRIGNLRIRCSVQARAAALAGRIHVGTDNERAASREYRRSAALAQKNRDLDARTSALVFGSDVLRSRGHYRQALEQLAVVFTDNELYARPFTRVWGYFYRGQTLCASGQSREGLRDLERCKANSIATGNQQAVAWVSLTLGGFRRISNVSAAEAELDDCYRAMDAYGGGLVLCETRLAWERAELDRARGDHAASMKKVRSLRSRIANRKFPVKLPYMEPHLSAIEAEISRDERRSDALLLLRRSRQEFSAGEWAHGVARIDVSLWLANGRRNPPAQLTKRCIRAGYGLEVERLSTRSGGYYALISL